MRKGAVAGAKAGPGDAADSSSDTRYDVEEAPREIAECAESLKELTNQEISERLESATQAVTTGLELDEITW